MLTDEQKQKVSDHKERVASTLASMEPRISGIVPGKIYSDPAASKQVTQMDPITGMIVTMQQWWFWERQEQRDADESAQDAAKRQKELAEQRQRDLKESVNSQLGRVEDIPTEQKYIKGANKCNRVWGRNNLVGVVLQQHATKIEIAGGTQLIIPGNMQELGKEMEQLWERAVFIEPVAVSPWIDEKMYPGLALIRDDLAAGRRAATLEICPGAGTPRIGANGEACIFLNAQHVWMEFWNEEKLGPPQPVDKIKGIGKRLLALFAKVAGRRNR